MDQNSKHLYLYQAITLIWFLSLAFMTLVWSWALLTRQEIYRHQGPGFNLKEF
jgi:hypothetical protein